LGNPLLNEVSAPVERNELEALRPVSTIVERIFKVLWMGVAFF